MPKEFGLKERMLLFINPELLHKLVIDIEDDDVGFPDFLSA